MFRRHRIERHIPQVFPDFKEENGRMATRFMCSDRLLGAIRPLSMTGVCMPYSISRSFPGHALQRFNQSRHFSAGLSGNLTSSQCTLDVQNSFPLRHSRRPCTTLALPSTDRPLAGGNWIDPRVRISFQTRYFADQHGQRAEEAEHGTAKRGSTSTNQSTSQKPLSKSLQAARERTEAVRERVRSAIPGLTPHENIWNIPNLLTVSRLIAAPVTAYLLLHDHYLWAMATFAYAGITDLIDGWMARHFKLQTVAGSVMDPMADKALMIIVTVTLAVKGALPLYLATLILGRDASLAIAAIYYRYASLPSPKTFMRYWDFSLPSAEVHPTTVSKYNTFLQLLLIGSTLALPVITGAGQYYGLLETTLGLSDHALRTFMTGFQILVAGTTAWSGLSYAFLKDAVTILGKDEKLKAKQGARGRAIIGITFGGIVAAAAWFAYQELGLQSEHDDGEEDKTKPETA